MSQLKPSPQAFSWQPLLPWPLILLQILCITCKKSLSTKILQKIYLSIVMVLMASNFTQHLHELIFNCFDVKCIDWSLCFCLILCFCLMFLSAFQDLWGLAFLKSFYFVFRILSVMMMKSGAATILSHSDLLKPERTPSNECPFQLVRLIGSSEPMQNDQTYFYSNIFFKFYNIIKIII